VTGDAATHDIGFAVAAMGGQVIAAGSPGRFAGAATDSRQVQAGQMFFALTGERVDGFAFVGQAVAAGATAVVVQAGRGAPAGVISLGDLAERQDERAAGSTLREVKEGVSVTH